MLVSRPALVAGHSVPSGILTIVAKRGAPIFKMNESRHRSVETLRGYVRDMPCISPLVKNALFAPASGNFPPLPSAVP